MPNFLERNTLLQPILAAIEAGDIPIGYTLGAPLGAALKRKANINLSQYNGLRSFCDTHLAPLIHYLGRIAPKTGDSLYYVRGQLGETMQEEWASIDTATCKQAWDFYSNPLLGARLAIDEKNSILWTSLHPSLPLPPGTIPFPGISIEALTRLIPRYIDQCPAELKTLADELRDIAQRVDPRPAHAWPTIIRTARFIPVLDSWEQWLLRTHGATSLPSQNTATLTWLATLFASGINGPNQPPHGLPLPAPLSSPAIAASGKNPSIPGKVTPELKLARTIAVDIIQKMSYEQLRELNLPFGMVLDALATK